MRRAFLSVLFVSLFAIGAQAQTPTPAAPRTSPGPVMKIWYHEIKPGKANDYTKDAYENTKPICDEMKKQGLILDCMFFTQPLSDGPNAWDRAFVVVFKNYADATEASAEWGQKFNEITLKHYGSAEARTKQGDLMAGVRDVVSSQLMRQIIINPMPPK